MVKETLVLSMVIQPAAMRYTEVRMDQASTMLIDDIDKNTIDLSR